MFIFSNAKIILFILAALLNRYLAYNLEKYFKTGSGRGLPQAGH